MDPRKLEAFADQEWIATRALGLRDPHATQMARSRQHATLRNTGRIWEKFDEDKTRVLQAEPHPGVEGLIGNREPAMGQIPKVPYQELVEAGGALDQPWGPYKFQPEFFSVNHTRGVSLKTLDVDPGPMYAISHGQYALPGRPNEDVRAPNLLNVTRAVGTAFNGPVDSNAQGPDEGSMGATAGGTTRMVGTNGGMGIPAAGAGRGVTIELNATRSRQATASHVDSNYELAQSVPAQWPGTVGHAGAGAATVDITPVGGQVALVTARDPTLTRQSVLGEARPGMGGTMADQRVSGGIVAQEGVAGPGAPTPLVQTVLHPLDAFPGTRMLLLQEKTGQIEAERFRKQVVQAAVRRQFVTQAMHPHGVLGVDSRDNEDSAVYGELAAQRRAAREAAATAAAHREAILQVSTRSDARRGYDIMKNEQPAGLQEGMLASARLAPGSVQPVEIASKHDGVKFMVEKQHTAEGTAEFLASVGGTKRVMVGEPVFPPSPKAAGQAEGRRKALAMQNTRGREFNPVTGLMRPEAMRPEAPPGPSTFAKTTTMRGGSSGRGFQGRGEAYNPILGTFAYEKEAVGRRDG